MAGMALGYSGGAAPGVIINVMNPHHTPALRMASWALLGLIGVFLPLSRDLSWWERREGPDAVGVFFVIGAFLIALVMGALSMNLPTIFMPAGPMLPAAA